MIKLPKREVICKPLRQGHLDLFQAKSEYQAQVDESVEWLVNLGKLDQAGIFVVDGVILFIGAWFYVMPGVIEVFIYPSIQVDAYPKVFFAEVQWYLDHLQSGEGVRRLQTWGSDTDLSKRWLESLGFKQEGLLYCYGLGGENVLIWGRVNQ